MKFYKKPEFLLGYYIILVIVAVLILMFLIFNYEKKDLVEESTSIYSDGPQIQPTLIVKDDGMIEAEEELLIERNVEILEDGTVKISAYLKNISEIEDELVLQDFVEEIKFDQHVEFLESNVEAKNGSLFPATKKLEIAGYGPGPVSEKNSKFNLVLLDINFDNNTDSTDLYELSFKLDSSIESFIFSGAEFRSDKYILELDEYEHVL